MPLSVCATPIGNLEDITLRVLDELKAADVVLCEDTRRTGILLDRFGIETRLVSYHQHNEASRVGDVTARLERGERIALVSDAGLPGVNDPGARVIAAALELGAPVSVLPGASAVETALVASGLVGDRYQFIGYFPRRRSELDELARELARWPHPVVAFESPRRLSASLGALATVMPERRAAVCRELTKLYEEVERGTLAELAVRFGAPARGEVTVVLGGFEARAGADDLEAATAAVAELVVAGVPRKQAAEVVSRLTGAPRNALYRASL